MVQGLLKFNTLPNMLTTHPPMQMDGNFGIVGGICEMLVQSHAGGLDIMPSPVEAWPEGSVKGLKARGNVTVDFSWKNGKVSNVKLYSDQPKVLPGARQRKDDPHENPAAETRCGSSAGCCQVKGGDSVPGFNSGRKMTMASSSLFMGAGSFLFFRLHCGKKPAFGSKKSGKARK